MKRKPRKPEPPTPPPATVIDRRVTIEGCHLSMESVATSAALELAGAIKANAEAAKALAQQLVLPTEVIGISIGNQT